MDLSHRVLGTTIATQIGTRASAVLLQIGRDTFGRADLARVSCFNFTAAANLSAILNKELKVKDTADVFYRIAPSVLVLPRLGAVALAVLGAAFEVKRLGGEHPLENWVRNHTEHKRVEDIVTFSTLKAHSRRETSETRTRKARTAARRDQAHGLRVARFTQRQTKTG